MVFPAKRKAIFMHGCFWHSHDCGRGARVPSQNREYWNAKLIRTRERDESSIKALADVGWEAIVFWECELKDPTEVAKKLREYLH